MESIKFYSPKRTLSDFEKIFQIVKDFHNKYLKASLTEPKYHDVDVLDKFFQNGDVKPKISPYAFYNLDFSSRIMFIMEKPGDSIINYQYEINQETEKYKVWNEKKDKNSLKLLIEASQNSLKAWFKTSHIFMMHFFILLHKKGFIKLSKPIKNTETYIEFIENDLIKTFYITDCVKLRKMKGNPYFNDLLKFEYETFSEKSGPKLIFLFGRLAWNGFLEIYPNYVENICNKYSIEKKKVKNIREFHGKWLYDKKYDTYLFPLNHFSATNGKGRKDYIWKLQDGLNSLSLTDF